MEASDMSKNVDRRDRPERCGVIKLNIFNVVDKDYFGMDSLNMMLLIAKHICGSFGCPFLCSRLDIQGNTHSHVK